MKLLLLVAAILHDRRTDPVHVHVLRAARLADAPHLLGEDRMAPGCGVGAAVGLRPALGEPAAARERSAELARERRLRVAARTVHRELGPVARQPRVEERAQLAAERGVALGPCEFHAGLPSRALHSIASGT